MLRKGYFDIEEGVLIAFIIFVILTVALPEFIPLQDIGLLLTVTTFLFGILSGFFITNRWGRYTNLKTLLTNETGYLIGTYKLSTMISEKFAKKIADLIDEYLIQAFRYEIYEYHEKTEEYFYKIFEPFKRLKLKNKKETAVFNKVTDILKTSITDREEIFFLAKDRMPSFLYYVLWILATITIFSLFNLRKYTLTSSIITVLLSTSIVLVILVLRELDKLRWEEDILAFRIFFRVFDAIGKLRFYPDVSIKYGRIEEPKNIDYRLGIFKKEKGEGDFIERVLIVKNGKNKRRRLD